MCPLSNYGKPIKEYQGEGVLHLTNGTEYSCSFTAGQLSNGDIRLLCSFNAPYSLTASTDLLDHCTFYGITEEGHSIWSKDNIIWTPNNYNLFAFSLKELIVETNNLESAKKNIFYVDNFEFYGNAGHTDFLTLTLPELNTVKITRTHNFNDIVRDIHISRGIDITCEMETVFSSDDIITQFEQKTVELCLLMSVCRGTRVQWIYYEIVNGIGDVLYRAHYDTITRPYTPLSVIIREDIFGVEDTKSFLEQAYSTLCSNPELRTISMRLINSYLDSKEHGFMETRGIKMVVVLEIVKNYGLSNPGFAIPGNIISRENFTNLKNRLKEIIRDVFPEDRNLQTQFNQNIGGINRTTFREIIRRMCENLDLPHSENDLELITASRNHLIHQGKFYRDSASENDRRRLPPLESDIAELYFIQNFLDKMMLRLLGYHGNYVNCRDPRNFERDDRI